MPSDGTPVTAEIPRVKFSVAGLSLSAAFDRLGLNYATSVSGVRWRLMRGPRALWAVSLRDQIWMVA